MNASILKLFVLLALLFALLVAWTSRWTVFEAEALQDNALNRRELLQEQRVRRGVIKAADGTVIARSVPSGGGTFARRYPLGDLFGHPVGYSYLTLSRSGVEQARNDELTGERAGIDTILGELAGEVEEGEELVTTLDPGGQRVAIDALAGRRGAVVALEPRTGKVRVMASLPTYDPNVLRDARDLGALPEGAQLNRATAGQYPPGSTMKIVTAVAAIDSGRFSPESVVDGTSPKTVSGAPLENFGGQSFGPIPLTTALTNSVNTVWAEVATTLGGDIYQRYMERFGFYDRVPIDLPEGQRGRSGVFKTRGERLALTPATSDLVDVGRAAIGQGDVLASPLQMAMVASAVANGGRLMRPTLAERVVDADGRTSDDVDPETFTEVMSPETATLVGEMMEGVVNEGTGTGAALAGVSVAGKTGTAERNLNDLNVPWFIGFAPADGPRIAVAVVLEDVQGGTGGELAAPIARAVFQELAG